MFILNGILMVLKFNIKEIFNHGRYIVMKKKEKEQKDFNIFDLIGAFIIIILLGFIMSLVA